MESRRTIDEIEENDLCREITNGETEKPEFRTASISTNMSHISVFEMKDLNSPSFRSYESEICFDETLLTNVASNTSFSEISEHRR